MNIVVDWQSVKTEDEGKTWERQNINCKNYKEMEDFSGVTAVSNRQFPS